MGSGRWTNAVLRTFVPDLLDCRHTSPPATWRRLWMGGMTRAVGGISPPPVPEFSTPGDVSGIAGHLGPGCGRSVNGWGCQATKSYETSRAKRPQPPPSNVYHSLCSQSKNALTNAIDAAENADVQYANMDPSGNREDTR